MPGQPRRPDYGVDRSKREEFFDGDAEPKYPLVLTPKQAADLLQVPLRTIYDWSSRGRLDGCRARIGKHLRIHRDRLFQQFFGKEAK